MRARNGIKSGRVSPYIPVIETPPPPADPGNAANSEGMAVVVPANHPESTGVSIQSQAASSNLTLVP